MRIFFSLIVFLFTLPIVSQTKETSVKSQSASAACDTIVVPSFSQQADSVSALLQRTLGDYKIEGYRMRTRFSADKITFDTTRCVVNITVCENLYGAPLTPERIRQIYTNLSACLQPRGEDEMPQLFDFSRLTPRLWGKKGRLETYIPNALRQNGAAGEEYAIDETRIWPEKVRNAAASIQPWVVALDRPVVPTAGLEGKHFFLSASHGAYYNNKQNVWDWQRPRLFCTSEDLQTQSIVSPFLIPMLERAGAVVYTARERDPQKNEALADNDSVLAAGHCMLSGEWSQTEKGTGFLPKATPWVNGDEPFRRGTAALTSSPQATATYTLQVPQAGDYAVYISYYSTSKSTDAAEYTVLHAGGRSRFRVNQQMGGGTWVYLGTFSFRAGAMQISVRNASAAVSVLSTDAVRIGGGMGQTSYGSAGTSGLPRLLECSSIYGLFAGLPASLYASAGKGPKQRYNDDIRCRPYFVNYMAAGSPFLPQSSSERSKRVPFEYYVATHTDAGSRVGHDVVGTLACVTTWDNDNHTNLPAGPSRSMGRENADVMMRHMYHDLSRLTNGQWNQRPIWDRSYGETRLAKIPAHIIEMYSHQNFVEACYAHDPVFRYYLARSMYKGMVEQIYVSNGIFTPYKISPLAPHCFSARIDRDGVHPETRALGEEYAMAVLSWSATPDSLTENADAEGYILYTATNDGGFSNGQRLSLDAARETLVQIRRGRTYHFKISAFNAGGESDASEVLTVYAPLAQHESKAHNALLVNGFTRLSAPYIIDELDRRGIDLDEDLGVDWGLRTSYSGRQVCFNPARHGDEGPGALGHGEGELEGVYILGNTFSNPRLHATALLEATTGRCYIESLSLEAFEQTGGAVGHVDFLDFFAGLNRRMPHQPRQYPAFSKQTQAALAQYALSGGALFVSGSFIASDLQDAEARRWASETLHYEGSRADSAGVALVWNNGLMQVPVQRTPSASTLICQHPDALRPAAGAQNVMTYGIEGEPAAVYHPQARSFALGVPFESLPTAEARVWTMKKVWQTLFNE